MKKLIVSFLTACIIVSAAAAAIAVSYDGGAAGGFLYSGGSGARSAGMANSASADCFDASGAYFNPALITCVKNTEVTFYYMSPLEGVNFNVLSFALPVMEYGMMAFSRVELGVEGVERINGEGIKTGDFSDRSDAYMLTYAYPVTSSLSFGMTIKLITRSFDTYNANGFGLDAGASYDFGGVFKASASLINVTQPQLKTGSTVELYPMNMRAGGALYLLNSRVAITGDALFINLLSDGRDFSAGKGQSYIRYSGGAEFRPFDFIAVRGGVNSESFTAGGGITTENFTLDYAAAFNASGVVHNFGVTARFGEVPTEREKRLLQDKFVLSKDKERLTEGMEAMSYGQLYLTALNDFNTGKIDKAQAEVKLLQENKKGDPKTDKLASDIHLAVDRRAAGLKFDDAAAYILKGMTQIGLAMIKDAEKIYPGITDAKIKEYMDNGAKEIENRKYLDAKKWYESILAVDPTNIKAAEMLGKIQDLTNMMNK